MNTQVTKKDDVVSFAPIEYNVTEAALAEYRERFKDAECDTKKGYELVRVGIGELVNLRNRLEDMRLDYKRQVKKFTDERVDGVAKKITAELVEIETDLKDKKKAIDDEKERIKQEKIDKENARVERIMVRVKELKCEVTEMDLLTMEELQTLYDIYDDADINDFDYAEFEQDAGDAIIESRKHIDMLIEKRNAYDKQQETLRVEKQKADAERKELDAQQEKMRIEREKMEDQQRKIDADKARIAAEERARQDAIQKEKDDAALKKRLEAEAKKKAEAEQKQKEIDAENKRLADIEREKQRQLDMSDKDKLMFIQSAIAGIEIPALNNQDMYLNIKDEKDSLCKYIGAKIKSL